MGTGAVIVTNGPGKLRAFSHEAGLFKDENEIELPISEAISLDLKKAQIRDTTGCGDNFVGGVIANLALQLQKRQISIDLTEICAWGVVSGGIACFYEGGTYIEKYPGEKYKLFVHYYEKYSQQIGYGG